MNKNEDELQDLFNSELMTNSIPISNPESIYINNNQNNLKENKTFKEDIRPKEIKDSKPSNISKIYDLNNKIFSDDDMSLNKTNKLVKTNHINDNKNIINKSNDSNNSLMLSLNINEIQLNENNDIKKIIPNDIYNYIRYSGNQLINNTKEGLKKLFIYLSDSLNNQKKINGSNDYYYNNDLNSENLFKIYLYIMNIINKNENKIDIINESLFIFNLILPLLPTMYINNICVQLIEKFYFKTAFDELNKNNYLLFKQILRLNQDTFFDKIFLLLQKEKNKTIKKFWKIFIFDLIKKNNQNCGIDYFENDENIINILNEYHKDDLVNFCLDLFDYNDLNEINSNKDAIELIKIIADNNILNNGSDEIISFKDMIIEKTKDNDELNSIISNIFSENDSNNIRVINSRTKKINVDEKIMSGNFGTKNDLNSGSYFLGSFGTFNAHKNNNYFQNNNINNKYGEDNEKYPNNEIFEVMNNNIIYDNDKENNIIEKKPSNKKEEKIINSDSKNENMNLYSDKEEDSIDENINNINKNIGEEYPLKFKEKNSGDSVVNYKYSISNKDIMNVNNQKNDKKTIKKNNNNLNNNNKNQSKRTSKISEFYDYFNKRNTLNNNLFSSFSSFSSVKGNSNDVINDDEIKEENNDNENNSIKNKIFLNLKKNNNKIKQDNEINEEIKNYEDRNVYNNINIKNNQIINNDNFLDLINNEPNIKMKNDKPNNNKIKEEINLINNINVINSKNNDNILKNDDKKGFDFEKCLYIIDKGKWGEKQEQIKLLKKELETNLSKDNYKNSEMPIDIIINLINQKLNEKQQKLVILIFELLEIIINKLNEIFNEEYLAILSKSIINNLNDNNIQLRYKAATVILKILKFNKRDFFISQLIESLKVDKNNMRIEILTILTQYYSSSKNSFSKKAIQNYFELLTESLVLCIEDKFNKIRNLSEDLIKESTKYIPIDRYYKASKDLYSKVVQDKVNSKIKEIYGLDNKDELKKSDKSIRYKIDSNNLSKSKIKKERSKSVDLNNNINNNNKFVKKKVNRNIDKNNNSNYKMDNKNINVMTMNNNSFKDNKKTEEIKINYNNIFKKNQNFRELKKFRNNKDIKLNKNYLSIREKSNILIQNQKLNSYNEENIRPLFQIFTNDFINHFILPCNKDLNQILFNINNILLNILEKSFISDFLPNLDIILEFIIRLFDKNLIEKKLDFILTYITFLNNLFEKLVVSNLKLTQIENNMIIHSLIYLTKYNQKETFKCIQNYYNIISVDRTFRILLDYNDVNDIDIQKNIIELFKKEINKENIDIMNDNCLLLKKMIKVFNKGELVEIGKEFFKYIYEIIGDKNFEEFISKLNKQDKNIILKNIDFYSIKDKIRDNIKKNNSHITQFKIDLSNMNDLENKNNKVNDAIISDLKTKKLINKDNNTINEKPKNEANKEIYNINNLNSLLKKLNSLSDEFDIEIYNKENDINNNNIISNKFNLITILKDEFTELNYQKNKNIIIQSIEIILDSLSKEINFFFNINTMFENCANLIIKYIQEIISLFLIISTKQDIISILNEDIINKLIILFLNYLEIDKEERISEINDIFKDMLQKINKITLNIIQKGKRELIIIILIKLISNFKEESDLSLLAINCLVKLIKITNFKKCNIVDILIEIIIAVEDEDLFLNAKNKKINELFLKTLKKLLNQLVIEKKYDILKDYQIAINRCNIKDIKVTEWIQKILEHNKF